MWIICLSVLLIHYTTGVLTCQPDIVVGSNSKLYIGGVVFLGCKVYTCKNLSKVVFEKTGIDSRWTSVYLGVNKSYHYALDTETGYTLKWRVDYTAFPMSHVLNIHPLVPDDHGKWRCVVYKDDTLTHESQSIEMHIYVTPNEEILRVEPRSLHLVVNQTADLTCTYDGEYTDPTIVWNINGIEHVGQTTLNITRRDGFRFIINAIRHKFSRLEANEVRCVVKTNTTKPWLYHTIITYVKGPAKIFYPRTDMYIAMQENVPFTLNCVGTENNKSLISWRKNGVNILGNETEYVISRTCNDSVCVGSFSSIPSRLLDYTGQYTCVVSLEAPYNSTVISPFMNVYYPQEVGDKLGFANILYPQEDLNITSNNNSAFTLNCTGVGYKPDVLWRRNDKEIFENNTNYIINSMCNASMCESFITPNVLHRDVICNATYEYSGVYTCVIIQEPPYQSSAASSDMTVYWQHEICTAQFPVSYIIGLAIAGLCLLILAPTTGISIYLRTKINQDIEADSVYAYIDVDDIVSDAGRSEWENPDVKLTYAEMNGISFDHLDDISTLDKQKYSYCTVFGNGNAVIPRCAINPYYDLDKGFRTCADRVLSETDIPNSVFYKSLDRQGRATYVGKDEILGMHNVQMKKSDHTNYINVYATDVDGYFKMDGFKNSENSQIKTKINDYLTMNSPVYATDIDKDIFGVSDLMEIASHAHATYANNEIIESKSKKKYRGILVEKPDFDEVFSGKFDDIL